MLAVLGEVVPLSDDDIDALQRAAQEQARVREHPAALQIVRRRDRALRGQALGVSGRRHRPVPDARVSARRGIRARRRLRRPHRRERSRRSLDKGRYAGTTHIGKTGIEQFYEDELHGEPGYEKIEVNVDHRPIGEPLGQRRADAGREHLPHDRRTPAGSRRGRVRRPRRRRDRDRSAQRRSARDGQRAELRPEPVRQRHCEKSTIPRCSSEPDKPLLNRAIARRLHAGLDGEAVSWRWAVSNSACANRKTPCLSIGEFFIPGQSRGYRDDKRGGHGRVDLVQAIAQSVNTYFYSLAYDMGIDRFVGVDGQVRFRQADRHRPRRRERRRAAVAGMEARRA